MISFITLSSILVLREVTQHTMESECKRMNKKEEFRGNLSIYSISLMPHSLWSSSLRDGHGRKVVSKHTSLASSILFTLSWVLFSIYSLTFPSQDISCLPLTLISFFLAPIYFLYQSTITYPLHMTKLFQDILLNSL